MPGVAATAVERRVHQDSVDAFSDRESGGALGYQDDDAVGEEGGAGREDREGGEARGETEVSVAAERGLREGGEGDDGEEACRVGCWFWREGRGEEGREADCPSVLLRCEEGRERGRQTRCLRLLFRRPEEGREGRETRCACLCFWWSEGRQACYAGVLLRCEEGREVNPSCVRLWSPEEGGDGEARCACLWCSAEGRREVHARLLLWSQEGGEASHARLLIRREGREACCTSVRLRSC